MSSNPQLLTISEASAFLQCHPNSLRLWEKKGLVKSIRFGVRGDRRYEKEELLRLMHSMKRPQTLKTSYEGSKDFQKLFQSIVRHLRPKDFYWAFAFNTEYLDPKVRLLLKLTHDRIAQKGIEDRALYKPKMAKSIRQTYAKNRNIRLRMTTDEIPNGVIILKDRVVFLLWGPNPSAFEVQETQVVHRYQHFFQRVWKEAKA